MPYYPIAAVAAKMFTGTKNLIKRLLQQPVPTTPYDEGFSDRLKMFGSAAKNPYPPGTANAREWDSGHYDANDAMVW